MKTIIIVAIAATVGISAFFLLSHSSKGKAFSITGNWKIDSVSVLIKDSLKQRFNSAGLGKVNDSIRFSEDSVLVLKNSIKLKYYQQDSLVFIKTDSSVTGFHLIQKADSSIVLNGADSTVFVLRKL